MANIGSDTVIHVAELAKLKLSKSDIEMFGKQLSEVVSFISQLNEVDTSGDDPISQTTGLTNVFAVDKTQNNTLLHDEALSGSRKISKGYFVVDAIFQTKDV